MLTCKEGAKPQSKCKNEKLFYNKVDLHAHNYILCQGIEEYTTLYIQPEEKREQEQE